MMGLVVQEEPAKVVFALLPANAAPGRAARMAAITTVMAPRAEHAKSAMVRADA